MKRVITLSIFATLTLGLCVTTASALTKAQEKKFDSLFVLASVGEIKYKDLVGPAKDSIAAMGGEVAVLLIDKFDTKSARERVTILEILKKIGKGAVPELVKALHRPNGLVVERVCNSLAEIGDSAAVPGLLGVTGHPRWQVREQSTGALGKCHDSRANNAVTSAMLDTIGQVRKAAAVAAGDLKLRTGIPALVHMLGDDFYGARMCALETLCKLDTANVITILADSILSSNAVIGDRACAVLGRLRTQSARNILMEQVKSVNARRRSHAGLALIYSDPADSCGLQKSFVDVETNPRVKLQLQSARGVGNSSK